MIAINTLEAMALQLSPFFPGHLLCPMIDARRMEVYTAVFNDQNQFIQETRAVIMDAESFGGLAGRNKVVFFGDGAAKCKPLFSIIPMLYFPKWKSNHLPGPLEAGCQLHLRMRNLKMWLLLNLII
jgi:tRNA threonylcarbamoyladenosine biosynthesis protein TsaB